VDQTLCGMLYTPDAAAASGIIVAGPTLLWSLRALSSSGARRYVQLFDSVGDPPDGTTPHMVIQLEPNAAYDWHCHGLPRGFARGLTWGWSSVGNVKTLALPECWLEVQYMRA
jgi:hypothetical protein